MAAHADERVCLYPTYLDAEKTWSGGRRVPKDKAVEKPDIREMYDAVTRGLNLEVEAELERKYCRDWMQIGRLRVTLKEADGTLCNKDIPDKKTLLIKCAELCARHPERPLRLAEIKKFEAQLFGSLAPGQGGPTPPGKSAAASSSSAPAAKASSKSNKKKSSNKKK